MKREMTRRERERRKISAVRKASALRRAVSSRAFCPDEEGRNENNLTSNEAKWHHRETGEEVDRQS